MDKYSDNNVLRFAKTESLFGGVTDSTVDFLVEKHFCDRSLWKMFVNEFRLRRDGETNAWRGEYWGKSMRGAVLVYQYRSCEELYDVLSETVDDLLTVVGDDGRVSTYTVETEFNAWDMWSRKYVMLGLEFYLEICRDEAQKERIIEFLRVVADYIIKKVGKGEGQIRIVDTSKTWRALNSCSILEPMVRLYKLTEDKKYFDFAAYIVEEGGAKDVNVFEMAYENKLYPFQYGANKAYELMSCFEGLAEFYTVTGIEKYKTAVVNFAKGILASDFTVIGTAGITHELLDHSSARQTTRYDGVSQETCVTVTLMKLFSLLYRLTGESCFGDALEKAYYNAYLGAVNTEDKICPYGVKKFGIGVKDTPMPFDSYSPLIAGKRGQKIGGSQNLEDNSYYGCCACIAGAGIGIYAKTAVLVDDKGLTLNVLERGAHKVEYKDASVIVDVRTSYPVDGHIEIEITSDKEISFELRVRRPSFVADCKVSAASEPNERDGHFIFTCDTSKETEIILDFDMPVIATTPMIWEEDTYFHASYMNGTSTIQPVTVKQTEEERNYISLSRGPITLAADSSLGKSADAAFSFDVKNGIVAGSLVEAPDKPCIEMIEFVEKNGEKTRLIDYASAGRDWETLIAAWMRTK